MAIIKVSEALLKKYPHLEKNFDNTIFLSETEHCENLLSETIQVDGALFSKELLRKLIISPKYLKHVKKLFLGSSPELFIGSIQRGKLHNPIKLNRIQIVHGISKLIQTGELSLSKAEEETFRFLERLTGYDSYVENSKNKLFKLYIDGNECCISISDIISFMNLSENDFIELCENPRIKELHGMKKEHFIYAVAKYFSCTTDSKKYELAFSFKSRYRDIIFSKFIDIEAINKFVMPSDPIAESAVVSDELKDAILSNMPRDFSDLQKAIYIYIKMCKLLTYNTEYFAVAQIGDATLKHKNVGYITQITPKTNEVVCYEFNLIYAKMLEYLGINYKIISENKTYGDGHSSLEFRCGKFLISADAVTSILNGDLLSAKLNDVLNGIECFNRNKKTKEEFETILLEVYKVLTIQESGKKLEIQPESLDDLIAEYSKLTQNLSSVSLEERLLILVEKANSKKLTGLDELSYMIRLRNALFDKYECLSNINICILRDNAHTLPDRVATISTVITINKRNVNAYEDTNIYFVYGLDHRLNHVTLSELKEKFKSGELEYIKSDDDDNEFHSIPGIHIEKGAVL